MKEVIILKELKKKCADIDKLKEHKDDIFVRFGKYRNNDVDWMICDIDDEKEQMLLITEKIIGPNLYHNRKEKISWEKCSLRILISNCVCFGPEKKFLVVNEVNDYIFLLNTEEAGKLRESQRKAKSLKEGNGELLHGGDNRCWWWLRQEKEVSCERAPYVDAGGSINEYGAEVTTEGYGVRLAVRVDLSKM